MKRRALLWLCLVLLPSTALAQGTIAGVARDANGRVLPGVTVELGAAADQGQRRSTVTDAAGRYEFRDVPPGAHSVTFRLPGFSIERRHAAVAGAGATVTVDGVLRVSALQDTTQLQRPLPPSSVPPEQTQARCLHGDGETAAEYQRRSDAFGAMHMIDRVLMMASGPGRRAPSWEQLGASGAAAALRGLPGPVGDLARRFRWGEGEPLPGWSILYVRPRDVLGQGVPAAAGVRFALRDERDPCGFTYSSEDPQVLPRGFKILPLYED